MDILIASIRKTGNRLIIFGVSFLLFGGFMIYISLFPLDASMAKSPLWGKIFILGLGAASLIMAMYFIKKSLAIWNPENSRVIKTLEGNPRDIVWVYEYTIESIKYGMTVSTQTSIYINFMDGEREIFSVAQKNREPLMSFLKSKLPHTVFGYSKELETQFKRDPMSLI